MVAEEVDVRLNPGKGKEKISPQDDFFKKPGV
jgi:hypothetical protein